MDNEASEEPDRSPIVAPKGRWVLSTAIGILIAAFFYLLLSIYRASIG